MFRLRPARPCTAPASIDKGCNAALGACRSASGYLLLAVLLSLAAAGGRAQNLVTNGDFDTDVSSWIPQTGGFQWSGLDPFGDPNSGSAEVDAVNLSSLTVAARQCIPLGNHPTQTGRLSAQIQRLAATGEADVVASVFNNNDCTLVPQFSFGLVSPAGLGWTHLETEAEINASAQSVLISLRSRGAAGVDKVRWDDVEFELLGADLQLTANLDPPSPSILGKNFLLSLDLENLTQPTAENSRVAILFDTRLSFVGPGLGGCSGALSAPTANSLVWHAGNLGPSGSTNPLPSAHCGLDFRIVGAPGSIVFVVDALHDDNDPNTANNSSTEFGTIEPHTDLTPELITNPTAVSPGQTFDLTVRVHNTGSAGAPNVEPSITFDSTHLSYIGATGCNAAQSSGEVVPNLGFISANQSQQCDLEFEVGNSAPNPVTIEANIIAGPIESNLTNNQTSTSIGVVNNAFIVDDAADRIDTNLGDGNCTTSTGSCSLRAAIMEANAFPGLALVVIGPGGQDSTLSLASGLNDEDFGDLDITDDLIVLGFASFTQRARIHAPSARGTGDRVFEIHGDIEVSMETLDIRGGSGVDFGGGILQNDGMLTLTTVDLRDNHATTGGGLAAYGDVEMNRSRFIGNSANAGGGIWSVNPSSITADATTFYDNHANALGGALFLGDQGTFTDSTFSDNTAGSSGGAIYVSGNGNLGLLATTVAYNEAGPDDLLTGNGGGVFAQVGAQVEIFASVLEGNIARTGGAGASCAGTIQDAVHSVIFPAPTNCGVTTTTNVTFDSALLAPLALDGAFIESHALLPGSSAIDLVPPPSCIDPLIDQAGRPRIVDADGDGVAQCDAGSREASELPLFADGFESGNTSAWMP